jgi:hypothetical protein
LAVGLDCDLHHRACPGDPDPDLMSQNPEWSRISARSSLAQAAAVACRKRLAHSAGSRVVCQTCQMAHLAAISMAPIPAPAGIVLGDRCSASLALKVGNRCPILARISSRVSERAGAHARPRGRPAPPDSVHRELGTLISRRYAAQERSILARSWPIPTLPSGGVSLFKFSRRPVTFDA